MITILWLRNDFWTWLFLDLLWPVYFAWAFYLYCNEYRLKRSPAKRALLRVSFWSLLALAGVSHWLIGKPRLVLSGHEGIVTSLAFSPDGRFLASGSWDRTIKIWNPVSGENHKTLAMGEYSGSGRPVNAVAFSPDGKIFAAGSLQTVSLWDTQSWTLHRNLRLGGGNPINSLTFLPTGRLIIASNSRVSGVWDVVTGESVLSTVKHLGSFVTLSPDGKLLAAVSGIGGVNILNTNNWERLFRLTTTVRSVVSSVAFSPDGRILAGGDGQNNLALWMTPDQQYVPNVLNKIGCGGEVASLTFSPNGKWLAAIASRAYSKPGCIKLFRLQDGQFTFMPWQTDPGGHGLAFSPDSKTLATPGDGNTIKLWRVD